MSPYFVAIFILGSEPCCLGTPSPHPFPLSTKSSPTSLSDLALKVQSSLQFLSTLAAQHGLVLPNPVAWEHAAVFRAGPSLHSIQSIAIALPNLTHPHLISSRSIHITYFVPSRASSPFIFHKLNTFGFIPISISQSAVLGTDRICMTRSPQLFFLFSQVRVEISLPPTPRVVVVPPCVCVCHAGCGGCCFRFPPSFFFLFVGDYFELSEYTHIV